MHDTLSETTNLFTSIVNISITCFYRWKWMQPLYHQIWNKTFLLYIFELIIWFLRGHLRSNTNYLTPTKFTQTAYAISSHCAKFSIKDFFSKYDQIHSFLQIWSHLLKKSLMENFIFYAVSYPSFRNFSVPFFSTSGIHQSYFFDWCHAMGINSLSLSFTMPCVVYRLCSSPQPHHETKVLRP